MVNRWRKWSIWINESCRRRRHAMLVMMKFIAMVTMLWWRCCSCFGKVQGVIMYTLYLLLWRYLCLLCSYRVVHVSSLSMIFSLYGHFVCFCSKVSFVCTIPYVCHHLCLSPWLSKEHSTVSLSLPSTIRLGIYPTRRVSNL